MVFKFLSEKPFITLVVIAALIGVSIPFQINIDRARGKFQSINQTLYFNSSVLNKMSLGYQELLADIYWIRALQYFGGDNANEDGDSELLYRYFDIMTDLDPKFVNAYRYGGTFLAEPYPLGFGDFGKGVMLLDKGRENNPDSFRIPFEEGFLYYIYDKDYEKAGELFNEASEKPGLSDFRRALIKGMAATSLKEGNNRELSKQIWEEIYNTTTNETRKAFALRNLKELNTRDFEDRLTSLANLYEDRFGEFPSNLNDLLETRYLKKIPVDHNGQEFILIPRIKSIKSRSLLKIDLDEKLRFLNAKSRKYRGIYGRYPKGIGDLRYFVTDELTADYPENPFGEEYKFDPETGWVSYESDLLD